MSTAVRVRFAPSPTGLLHVGGVRSALFNYLWARHNDGVFILRLEDTDQARLVNGAAQQIDASLRALGLTPDEGPEQGGKFGPYRQSERLSLYREHAERLLKRGTLYPCWCSPERLDGLRRAAQAAGTAFKYDRHCLSEPQSLRLPHVLRFRVPEEPATITWNDAVRGRMTAATREVDDFVAVKSDGFPTYQFANVIDDHLMAISHVLRADEWLPSTPKHLLLFAAFDWEPPVYAHLPAILGPDGRKKLSKRDGAQSVMEYLADGYLAAALISFLATLGWNDGTTQEVYRLDELIARFELDRIQKSPANFDRERLTWVNGYLIRQLSIEELADYAEPFWPESARSAASDYRLNVLRLVQERLKYLAELPDLTDFFFADPPVDLTLVKGIDRAQVRPLLSDLRSKLGEADWTLDGLETALRGFVSARELKTGPVFGLIRLAITGRTAAPGLFETLAVLGRETVVRRLERAEAAAGV